ncbi:TDRD1_4_6_7 [Acanthosepion pharaonis]|uniref:TDRD1_4_6_7 n=1 Tax=Acanthosepion pharaonis TaxID=158019 RepID=A0A812B1N8_ACAPH|nr:TDRD1_4_6_7 [Sepia pharaonis]
MFLILISCLLFSDTKLKVFKSTKRRLHFFFNEWKLQDQWRQAAVDILLPSFFLAGSGIIFVAVFLEWCIEWYNFIPLFVFVQMASSRQIQVMKLRVMEKLDDIFSQQKTIIATINTMSSQVKKKADRLLKSVSNEVTVSDFVNVLQDLERCFNNLIAIAATTEDLFTFNAPNSNSFCKSKNVPTQNSLSEYQVKWSNQEISEFHAPQRASAFINSSFFLPFSFFLLPFSFFLLLPFSFFLLLPFSSFSSFSFSSSSSFFFLSSSSSFFFLFFLLLLPFLFFLFFFFFFLFFLSSSSSFFFLSSSSSFSFFLSSSFFLLLFFLSSSSFFFLSSSSSFSFFLLLLPFLSFFFFFLFLFFLLLLLFFFSFFFFFLFFLSSSSSSFFLSFFFFFLFSFFLLLLPFSFFFLLLLPFFFSFFFFFLFFLSSSSSFFSFFSSSFLSFFFFFFLSFFFFFFLFLLLSSSFFLFLFSFLLLLPFLSFFFFFLFFLSSSSSFSFFLLLLLFFFLFLFFFFFLFFFLSSSSLFFLSSSLVFIFFLSSFLVFIFFLSSSSFPFLSSSSSFSFFLLLLPFLFFLSSSSSSSFFSFFSFFFFFLFLSFFFFFLFLSFFFFFLFLSFFFFFLFLSFFFFFLFLSFFFFFLFLSFFFFFFSFFLLLLFFFLSSSSFFLSFFFFFLFFLSSSSFFFLSSSSSFFLLLLLPFLSFFFFFLFFFLLLLLPFSFFSSFPFLSFFFFFFFLFSSSFFFLSFFLLPPFSFFFFLFLSFLCFITSKYNLNVVYGIACPYVGMTCIAPFTDGSYYRARVLSVLETQNPDHTLDTKVNVLYVDYGNMDVIPSTSLIKMPKSLAKFPTQAICCSLAKVMPHEIDDDWSACSSEAFHNMVYCKDFVCNPVYGDNFIPQIVDLYLLESTSPMTLEDLQTRQENKIYSLPQPYSKMPALARHCALAYVQPEGPAWPDEAKTAFKNMIKVKETYFIKMVDGSSPLDIPSLENYKKAPVEVLMTNCYGSTGNGSANAENEKTEICLNYELIEMKHADLDVDSFKNTCFVNWDPMLEDFDSRRNCYEMNIDDAEIAAVGFKVKDEMKICKFFRDGRKCWLGKNCPYKHIHLEKDCLTTDKRETVCDVGLLGQIELPLVRSLVGIEVSAISSPVQFYVIFPWGTESIKNLNSMPVCPNKEETLPDLQESLQEYYKKLRPRAEENLLWTIGELVVARAPADEQWYRARITEVNDTSNAVKVFFVDFGNVQWIPEKHIQPIQPQFIHLPHQAVECCLDGIASTSTDGLWTQEARDYFLELVDDVVLVARVNSIISKRLYIDLYNTSKEEDQNIAEELVRVGVARKISPKAKPSKKKSPVKITGQPESTKNVLLTPG